MVARSEGTFYGLLLPSPFFDLIFTPRSDRPIQTVALSSLSFETPYIGVSGPIYGSGVVIGVIWGLIPVYSFQNDLFPAGYA